MFLECAGKKKEQNYVRLSDAAIVFTQDNVPLK